MSGLTRSATLALPPAARATSSRAASSENDSTLNMRTPAAIASAISRRLLPTPEKTIFAAGTPARSARYSSPPETMSAPAPSFASAPRMAPLGFALTA